MITSPPPKPGRRLWRWYLLAAAVLIAGAWWAGRPQIDPRLVGKWRYDFAPAVPYVYEFHKNGRGKFISGSKESAFYWRSNGEAIFTSTPHIGHLLTLLPQKVREWIQGPVGSSVETRYVILRAEPDEVTLQMTSDSGRVPPQFTWIRIRE